MSENNSNFRLNGLNPLAYMGVNPRTPVPFFSKAADPTPTDYANFLLGTIWLNTVSEAIWMLVKKANFVSTWVQFSSGSSGTVISLTGDDGIPVLPLDGNINVIATSTAGSSVSFTGSTPNALKLNTTDALGNTIIGHSSGNGTLSGSDNTALGFSALNAITSGNNNTAIGESALAAVLTGSNNIAIGQLAGDNYVGAESSNILIGNLGVAAESDVIRIGAAQTSAYVAGVYNVTPSGTKQLVVINSSGQLGSTSESPIATTYNANSGTATPSGGVLNILGDIDTVTTTGSGNTITITATGGGSGSSASILAVTLASSSSSAAVAYGIGAPASTATLANSNDVVPTAGTISNLYINVFLNNSTSNDTVTLYKNNSPTSLVATITALTTGVYFDTTHSISVSQGDVITFVLSQSTTSAWVGNITAEFSGAGGGGSTGNSNLAASLSSSVLRINYSAFNATSAASTFSSGSGIMTSSGTLSNLYVNVISNGSTSNDTLTVYKNGSATLLSVTITSATTGIFSDTTDAVSVSRGDSISFVTSQSTTAPWVALVNCNFNG